MTLRACSQESLSLWKEYFPWEETQCDEQTFILCVWQAIHLNVPPLGEPNYKQTFRKIKWAFLAMIAPEFVAYSAWYET
jgi:hypothetical protein